MARDHIEYRIVRSPNSKEVPQEHLATLESIFQLLDRFATQFDGYDELTLETVNCLADILRAVVVETIGIDVRPVTELGPHGTVDLSHSLRVLSQVVSSIQQGGLGTDQSIGPHEVADLRCRIERLEEALQGLLPDQGDESDRLLNGVCRDIAELPENEDIVVTARLSSR